MSLGDYLYIGGMAGAAIAAFAFVAYMMGDNDQ